MRYACFGSILLFLLLSLGGSAVTQEIVEWRPLHGGPYGDAEFHLYARDSTGRLWGGEPEKSLFRSDDEGESWHETSFRRPVDLTVRSDGDLIAADDSGRVWSSYDNGESWVNDLGTIPQGKPLPGRIAVMPSGTIYVISIDKTDYQNRSSDLFRLRAGTTIWEEIGEMGGDWGRHGLIAIGDRLMISFLGIHWVENDSSRIVSDDPNPVIESPGHPVVGDQGRLYLSNGDAIFVSIDSGRSQRWFFFADLPDGATTFLQHEPPSTFYSSIPGSDEDPSYMIVSRDGGETWAFTPFVPSEAARLPRSRSLITANGTFLSGSGIGILRTSDHGVTWDTRADGVAGVVAHSFLATKAGSFVIGGGLYTYTTTDGGDSWIRQRDSLRPSPNSERMEFCVGLGSLIEDEMGRLYGTCSLGVYRSDDAGVSWKRIGLTRKNPELVRRVNGTLYAAPGYNLPVLWRSDDEGESWDTIDVDGKIYQLEYDPATGALYGQLTGGDWYESTDRGETWDRMVLSAQMIAVDTASGHLYAYTHSGPSLTPEFRYSTDHGVTWITVEPEEGEKDAIQDLAVAPTGDCFLLDIDGDLYRLRAEPFAWTKLENLGEIMDARTIGFDADGHVVIGTAFRGLWTSAEALAAGVRHDRDVPEIALSPNPARTMVTIRIPARSGNVSAVRITDASGRIVEERSVVVEHRPDGASLNLRLPDGMPALSFLQLAIDGHWSEGVAVRIAP